MVIAEMTDCENENNQREVLLHFTIVLSLLYQVTGIGQKPKILGKKNLLYFRSFRPRHKNTVKYTTIIYLNCLNWKLMFFFFEFSVSQGNI